MPHRAVAEVEHDAGAVHGLLHVVVEVARAGGATRSAVEHADARAVVAVGQRAARVVAEGAQVALVAAHLVVGDGVVELNHPGRAEARAHRVEARARLLTLVVGRAVVELRRVVGDGPEVPVADDAGQAGAGRIQKWHESGLLEAAHHPHPRAEPECLHLRRERGGHVVVGGHHHVHPRAHKRQHPLPVGEGRVKAPPAVHVEIARERALGKQPRQGPQREPYCLRRTRPHGHPLPREGAPHAPVGVHPVRAVGHREVRATSRGERAVAGR